MKRTDLVRGLPLFGSGPNRGRIDRAGAAKLLSLSPADFAKAYNNWIQIFRMPGSTLSLVQYLEKMKEAGIRPSDVSNRRGGYNLSRINDEGPYTNETCRFVLHAVNSAEQKRLGPYEHMIRKYGKDRARQILRQNGSANTGNLKNHKVVGP